MKPCGSVRSMRIKSGIGLLLMSLFAFCDTTHAENTARPIDGIADNSFLVEEAYNQEPGVVQHIFNAVWTSDRQPGPDDREWALVFTQEWPIFSQLHQFSYTVPYSFLETGGQSDNELGDILLNYRLQAMSESDTRPAFAPRISLVIPTSDESHNVGYDFRLPFSKVLADHCAAHANAGLTVRPGINGRDLVAFNLGASVIYAVSDRLHLLLEATSNWDETADLTGDIDRTFALTVSPGLRYAFNRKNGSQYVVGIGVPIGLTSDAPDFGIFLYGSIEYAFQRLRDD